jgi:hypothetical protein
VKFGSANVKPLVTCSKWRWKSGMVWTGLVFIPEWVKKRFSSQFMSLIPIWMYLQRSIVSTSDARQRRYGW